MFQRGKIILVTGATGAVGPRVVYALHQEGFQVRTFSLGPPSEDIFPSGVDARIGDVTDQASVQFAMQGVYAVIHLAALLHINAPPPEMRAKYERVNVGGTKMIVEAAINADVERVLMFSTIAVHGPLAGCVLNEMSPVNPESFYARSKYKAEQIVLNARREDGRSLGTVLRLGAVYGTRVKGNYERLTQALEQFRFVPIGQGLNRRTLVYDKDVGRAAVLAVTHPAAAGRLYNVTDGTFHTLSSIIEAICAALGRAPPKFSLPIEPTRTLTGLLEKGSRILGLKSPITTELIDKYSEDIAVDGSLIQKELGFEPKYDLSAGWAEAIREMRS